MTLRQIFWLPVFAITTYVLLTHQHVSRNIRVPVNSLEIAWNTLLSSLSVRGEDASPEATREKTPSLTTGHADIWVRLRSGFNLPQQAAPSVQSHIDTFRKHPRHIEQILRRGEPYLFYIVNCVEERGMPAEIALLPVIESAFDAFSRSPAGAAGIWQFMPATARHVGLRQDRWYDARRDTVLSTEAALDYMSELHQHFDGDWLLALAAYNAGRARVNKAIRINRSQGKPVDFWHLPLPAETRNYVPKLIALSAIISNPEEHNINLPTLANSRYFAPVDIVGQLDLQVAARLGGTSLDELQRLNPGLAGSITPPAGRYTLLIPTASEQRFRQGIARLPKDQRVPSVSYRVRRGDTLSTIAQKARTTVARLRQMNQLDSTRIIEGKLLIVPRSGRDKNTRGQLQTS